MSKIFDLTYCYIVSFCVFTFLGCGSWVGNPGAPEKPGGENDENPIINREEDVQFKGQLNLLESDDSSVQLTQAIDKYNLECVTTNNDVPSSCFGIVDALGSFDFNCSGFSGSKFACYLLDNSNAQSQLSDGVFLSNQLSVAPTSAKLEMVLDFVPSLKLGTISSISQFNDSGLQLPAQVDNQLHPYLGSLSINSNNYEVCYQAYSDEEAAINGIADIINEPATCAEYDKIMYLDFAQAQSTSHPQLSFWHDKESRDLCTNDDGLVAYDISDGSRTFSFDENQSVNMIEFFDFLYNSGTNPLIPRASLEILENFSGTDTAHTYDNELSTLIESHYGEDSCTKLSLDVKAGFESAEIIEDQQERKCMNLAYSTGNSDLDELLTFKVDQQLCHTYKLANAEQRKLLIDHFEVDCRIKYAGEANLEFRQKRQIVSDFLYMLGKQRIFSSNEVNPKLKDAFQALSELESLHTDNGNELFSGACNGGDIDIAISQFINIWHKEDWNKNRSEFMLQALADNKLNCSPISFQFEDEQFNYQNGASLLSYLLLNPFDEESGISGLQDVESNICSTDYLYDFTQLDTNAQYYQDLWNATARTQGMLEFLPGVNETTRKDVLRAFFLGVLGLNGGEPLVFGCSAHHMRNYLSWLDEEDTKLDDILENFGWRVVESRQRSDLLAINISPNSGNNPLTALDPNNAARRSELAEQEVLSLASEFTRVALVWFADLGFRINMICDRGIDLADLSGIEEGLACGQAVPDKYKDLGFCSGIDSCEFEELSGSKDSFGLLREIALFIAQTKAIRAFEIDSEFRQSVLRLNLESRCLPDASLSLQGFVDGTGRLNHKIQVRGPVTRDIGGYLQMDISRVQDNKQLLYIENSLLNIEKNFETNSCYEGNVNRIRSIELATDGSITGLKASGYGNTCIADKINNLNFEAFVARPISSE